MKNFSLLTAAALAAGVSAAGTTASALSVELSYVSHYTPGSITMKDTNSGIDFLTWCLDESAHLTSPVTYDVKFKGDKTIFDDKAVALEKQENIQSLFDLYYGIVDTNAERNDFSDALWYLADGKSWASLRTGAQNYINGLSSDNLFEDLYTLVFFDAPVNANGGQASQNLVAGFLGSAPYTATVPLPAAAWLLVAGLGALGVAGRRRKTT